MKCTSLSSPTGSQSPSRAVSPSMATATSGRRSPPALPRETRTLPIPSWLPAATQRLVELDQREQFIPLRLRQAELSAEEIAVRIQRIEQRIDAAPVAHVG